MSFSILPFQRAEPGQRSHRWAIVGVVLGIVLVAGALIMGKLPGAGSPGRGALRMVLYCGGAGLVAVGFLRLPSFATLNRPVVRWTLSVCIAAFSAILPRVWAGAPVQWEYLGYIAGICILLPSPADVSTLFGVFSLHVSLTWISRLKTSLTELPLTFLDLKIALADPGGLWDALSLPPWTRHVVIPALVVAGLAWVATIVVACLDVRKRIARRRGALHAVARILFMGLLAAWWIVRFDSLVTSADQERSAWRPEGVARLAERMGILPFVAYSRILETRAAGDIYQRGGNASPPRIEEISAATRRYMSLSGGTRPDDASLPNMLVVLAESTFDPGTTFRLKGLWDDRLFRPTERTVAVGPLRVNAVGGGTWITEFETIVGIDSRLFGYWGTYTHASLSPFVQRSFATYLRDHGYDTWAFFPHGGEFYNGRRAYQKYGFQHILDRSDLDLRRYWEETDVRIAGKVKEVLGPRPDAPFFGYVLFIENHGPHPCDVPDVDRMPVRFTDTLDFVPNCALHEYLRRLASTTSAVQSLLDYLADIEKQTGRPFVLLVFGDHQPHTFTGTGGFQYDYGPLRAVSDPRVTFFHLFATVEPKPLVHFPVAPPASLFPTLLSGFVARDPADVYLGEDLWLFDQCGTDAVERERVTTVATCEAAYERALAGYRASGVIRLGDSPGPRDLASAGAE